MKVAMTAWFPANEYKPVRAGEYEVLATGFSYGDNLYRLEYKDGVWRTNNGDTLIPPFGSMKDDAWRGLTKEVK